MKTYLIVLSTYVLFITAGVSAVTSSLNSTTVLHCNNGIQSACEYLASKGIK